MAEEEISFRREVVVKRQREKSKKEK